MIIGFTGKARSGKDTAADYLVRHFGYKKYSFADPLKETINRLMGWNHEHAYGDLKDVVDPKWGISPRYAYQTFGTEYCREHLREDFWLIKALEAIDDFKHVVIPDVRFENEANFIRERGHLIHIMRPGVRDVELHKSEDGVSRKPYDMIIYNDGEILDLHMQILKVLSGADILKSRYEYNYSQNVTY